MCKLKIVNVNTDKVYKRSINVVNYVVNYVDIVFISNVILCGSKLPIAPRIRRLQHKALINNTLRLRSG